MNRSLVISLTLPLLALLACRPKEAEYKLVSSECFGRIHLLAATTTDSRMDRACDVMHARTVGGLKEPYLLMVRAARDTNSLRQLFYGSQQLSGLGVLENLYAYLRERDSVSSLGSCELIATGQGPPTVWKHDHRSRTRPRSMFIRDLGLGGLPDETGEMELLTIQVSPAKPIPFVYLYLRHASAARGDRDPRGLDSLVTKLDVRYFRVVVVISSDGISFMDNEYPVHIPSLAHANFADASVQEGHREESWYLEPGSEPRRSYSFTGFGPKANR
jgi:hypothetical protein